MLLEDDSRAEALLLRGVGRPKLVDDFFNGVPRSEGTSFINMLEH